MRSQRFGCPEQHGIPMRSFARNQRFGMACAVEQEIRSKVPSNVLDHGIDVTSDAIDYAVGEPRHRHRHGVDDVLLCRPFSGDGCGNLRGSARHQQVARRRAHLLVIEQDGKAFRRFPHARMSVEALALSSSRGPAHRFFRIERRRAKTVFEQFTHDRHSSRPIRI